MFKKKIFCYALIICFAFTALSAFAEPIIELAAPRIKPRFVDDSSSSYPKQIDKTPNANNAKSTSKVSAAKKTGTYSKRKKKLKKKPVIKVDYNKVSKMIEYGYYDDADAILYNAIKINPKDINAYSLLVVSLAKQNKLDPAQSKIDNLIEKYPKNSNIHYAQGIVYYQRTTSSNMEYITNSQKLVNDSLNEFKKAIELDSNNARAYNAAGVISLKLEKYDDATNYFKKAITIDPSYSTALDNIGTLDFINAKYSEAESKFKDALKYNSKNSTAMYHLAQISMQKNDYNSAITYLNNALSINPSSYAIYNLLGRAYTAQGNISAAINSFKKSVSIKPEFTLSYIDLADIYEQRGDNEFAIVQLKTALSVDADNNILKMKLANLLLDSGKYQYAIDIYSTLINSDEYKDSALKGLACAYFCQAKSNINKSVGSKKGAFEAINYINMAIKINPNDLDLHLAKLRLSQYLGLPKDTQIELNKIINSPNDDMSSLLTKGEAYLVLSDYKNAAKSFESAIKLSESNQDNLYLSEILLFNKQYDTAKILLDKILQNDPDNIQAKSGMNYIKKQKDNANIYYNSAVIFIKQNNRSSAIEYLVKSVSSNPNFANAHLLLAQQYDKNKDYCNALNSYKAYVSLVPANININKIEKRIKQLDKKL